MNKVSYDECGAESRYKRDIGWHYLTAIVLANSML